MMERMVWTRQSTLLLKSAHSYHQAPQLCPTITLLSANPSYLYQIHKSLLYKYTKKLMDQISVNNFHEIKKYSTVYSYILFHYHPIISSPWKERDCKEKGDSRRKGRKKELVMVTINFYIISQNNDTILKNIRNWIQKIHICNIILCSNFCHLKCWLNILL